VQMYTHYINCQTLFFRLFKVLIINGFKVFFEENSLRNTLQKTSIKNKE
jgi:hypothetical protein